MKKVSFSLFIQVQSRTSKWKLKLLQSLFLFLLLKRFRNDQDENNNNKHYSLLLKSGPEARLRLQGSRAVQNLSPPAGEQPTRGSGEASSTHVRLIRVGEEEKHCGQHHVWRVVCSGNITTEGLGRRNESSMHAKNCWPEWTGWVKRVRCQEAARTAQGVTWSQEAKGKNKWKTPIGTWRLGSVREV